MENTVTEDILNTPEDTQAPLNIEEDTLAEAEGSKTVTTKNPHNYTFICSKCKRHIAIFSDISNKVEDKKALHSC